MPFTREGPRRQDRPLRAALPAHELRRRRRSTRSSTTRIRGRRAAASGTRVVRRGARRQPGAGRARLRRRHARRHGHAGPLEVVPRHLLRRDGPRQHAARPGGGHEGTGARASRGSTSIARRCGATPGGGFITADAMFRYPDFFKVGISESGNHDQRVYEDDWGERYQGLLHRLGGAHQGGDEPRDSYEAEANQTHGEEPEGQAAADARHDGRQRAAAEHLPGDGRADQGQQGLRPAPAAERSGTASAWTGRT